MEVRIFCRDFGDVFSVGFHALLFQTQEVDLRGGCVGLRFANLTYWIHCIVKFLCTKELKMARKEFTKETVERVLICCRRHCCVCEKFCGTKIELHHIGEDNNNSEENALPVCFDCHAEIKSYNIEHPKGRRFHPSELKKLRDATYFKYSGERQAVIYSSGTTDYGKGFHDGMELAEKRIFARDAWKFLALHGDFGIEVFTMFADDDTCSMMNETLYSNKVDTGTELSQHDGHQDAWDKGRLLGFWDVDGDRELLFLTKKGKFFQYIIQKTGDLNERYNKLKKFWDEIESGRSPGIKPSARTKEEVAPGWLGWLQAELFTTVLVETEKEPFILISVEESNITLKGIDSGKEYSFPMMKIKDISVDYTTGWLKLQLMS